MNQEPCQEARGEKKALQIQIYFITFTPTFYKKKYNMSIKARQLSQLSLQLSLQSFVLFTYS